MRNFEIMGDLLLECSRSFHIIKLAHETPARELYNRHASYTHTHTHRVLSVHPHTRGGSTPRVRSPLAGFSVTRRQRKGLRMDGRDE